MSKVNLTALTLGPNAAAVKGSVSHARWRRLVKTAHKRGFTVDSFLDPSTPGPLKQRTPSSLSAQAQRTMTAAYAPAEANLTQQETRIKAIDDKRKQDNQHYRDWLISKQTEMDTHGAAADQALLDAQRAIQAQTGDNYLKAHQELLQQGAATTGNVSDPAQARAFDITPQTKQALDNIAIEVNRTAQAVGTGEETRHAQDANNIAFAAAGEAKRVADTWQALQSVADDRTKLELQRGADSAKEISRLLDQEITKAQQNRDFAAVSEKLNLSALTLKQRTAEARANLGIKQGQLKINADSLAERTANNKARLGLAQSKALIDQGKLDVAWYKARHPSAGKNGTGAKSSNPQDRFEYGYAVLTGASRDVADKKGKVTHTTRITADYASRHQDELVSQVMTSTKVSHKMALLIVRAYILHGGKDPGHYTGYDAPGVTPAN